MNNSLPRLIDGMVATLRKEVIPHIDGDFARGQAYGVIYMLSSIKAARRLVERVPFEQLRALEETSLELRTLAAELPGAPLPDAREPREAARLPPNWRRSATRAIERICELIDWLAANRATVAPWRSHPSEAAIDKYLNWQSRFELKTSAKPMFVEMSGGVEKS